MASKPQEPTFLCFLSIRITNSCYFACHVYKCSKCLKSDHIHFVNWVIFPPLPNTCIYKSLSPYLATHTTLHIYFFKLYFVFIYLFLCMSTLPTHMFVHYLNAFSRVQKSVLNSLALELQRAVTCHRGAEPQAQAWWTSSKCSWKLCHPQYVYTYLSTYYDCINIPWKSCSLKESTT